VPVSPGYLEHALDLLAGAGPVRARRMFGGCGLYARGVMFGLLDDDELFLKTDEQSRPRFLAAGCRSWVYPGNPGPTSYYRPPDDAHEEAEAMTPWAILAIESALRLQAAKVARAGAAAARRRQAAGAPPGRKASARRPAPRRGRAKR
jgi:DNA transformation protein and related proteins